MHLINLTLYMNNFLKIYYWIRLSLRINLSYFLICWVAVVVAISMGLDEQITGARLPGSELSLWASINVFLAIVLYPIPVSVFILFLLDKTVRNVKRKKAFFLVINVIWNLLVVKDLSGSVNVLDDHKGVHNIYLFNFIMAILIVIAHVFWSITKRDSFTSDPLSDQGKYFKKDAVVFFAVYYFGIVISFVFCLFFGRICFDGFIFDEMLMTFNSTLTMLIFLYGLFLFLIKQLRFKCLIIIMIPVVYLSYNFFLLHSGNHRFTDYHKFRQLLVHYNPLWLSNEERGHDTINP